MISSGLSTSQSANDSYTDLSSVHAIRSVGLKNKGGALDEVARQFESMMVRMMLKSMRNANNVFAEGNFLSSHESDTYRQMYDDQLALSLTKGNGMGLAELIAKQLKNRFDDTKAASSEKKLPAASRELLRDSSTNTAASADKQAVATQANTTGDKAALHFDGSIHSFVEQIYPLAEKAALQLGIDPKVLIAQSALETGWGAKISKSANAQSSFNVFNIKADKRWQGESTVVPTLEFRDGLPVREFAAFRSYSSAAQSFADYVDFIHSSPRYQQALASGDSESYIRGISEAGYATDPYYADKILRIADSDELKQAVDQLAGTHARM